MKSKVWSSSEARAVESVFHHRADRGFGFEPGVLLDTGETGALTERDFSAVRSDLPCQNSKQRGFARSVRANQADAVPFRNGERDVLEEGIRSKGLGNFLRVDDRRQCCGVSGNGDVLRVSVQRQQERARGPGRPLEAAAVAAVPSRGSLLLDHLLLEIAHYLRYILGPS